MLDETEAARLRSALAENRALLFVGAGFSAACQNRRGRPLPLSRELAAEIWSWAGLEGEYDGSDLSTVYQVALQAGRTLASLRELLESHLLAVEIPAFYDVLSRIYWYRIYGTNADNVIEQVYQRSPGDIDLQMLAAPAADFRERDQFLRRVQYVKLHGTLPGDPRDLTFGTISLARRANTQDDWWRHFVRDYVYYPVVFIGSELNEPLFWQAIESRGAKGNNPESRPTSYLVSKNISVAKRSLLKALNIVYVEASAEEFFGWLAATFSFPDRLAVIASTNPGNAEILAAHSNSAVAREAIPEFLGAFERVVIPQAPGGHSGRAFLRGGAPTWLDIAIGVDAPLQVNDQLQREVATALAPDNRGASLIALLGEGGSGKSTVLRRVAVTLTQEGVTVFLSDGAERPDLTSIREALRAFDRRVCLFIDNAALFGPFLSELVAMTTQLPHPPVIVAASRYIPFEQRLRDGLPKPAFHEVEIPRLSDPDIVAVLATLERHSQLGNLLKMGDDDRRYEFKHRAQKQLLVAMREATEGRGFDEIIQSEFTDLRDREPRILFLCGALASAALVDLTTGQIFDCAEVDPPEALRILQRDLRGMLDDNGRGLVVARHPFIAEYIIANVAGKEEVMEAYRRVLLTLARDIYPGVGRRHRSWRLFVRLINHDAIFEHFGDDIDHARGVYELTADAFANDGHFWLQYANLEVDYGSPAFARPLIANAEGLLGPTDLVLNTRAHVMLRDALTVGSIREATTLRMEAEEILRAQMERARQDDEYPFHVYLTHMLSWIRAWSPDRATKKADLEHLLQIARETCDRFGRNKKLRGVHDAIMREYLRLAESSA